MCCAENTGWYGRKWLLVGAGRCPIRCCDGQGRPLGVAFECSDTTDCTLSAFDDLRKESRQRELCQKSKVGSSEL